MGVLLREDLQLVGCSCYYYGAGFLGHNNVTTSTAFTLRPGIVFHDTYHVAHTTNLNCCCCCSSEEQQTVFSRAGTTVNIKG